MSILQVKVSAQWTVDADEEQEGGREEGVGGGRGCEGLPRYVLRQQENQVLKDSSFFINTLNIFVCLKLLLFLLLVYFFKCFTFKHVIFVEPTCISTWQLLFQIIFHFL